MNSIFNNSQVDDCKWIDNIIQEHKRSKISFNFNYFKI